MNFIPLQKQVSLKPYRPRDPIPFELATDQELISNINTTAIFDTECYPNFWLAAFKLIAINKYVLFSPPFNECKLSWLMHNYKTVGFNSINYDLPILWAACANQNTNYLKEISDAIVFRNVWHQELQKEFGFKIFNTTHTDLIEVCPLKGSLKLYGARLHARRIQDLPIDINRALADTDINIVTNYCINDLDTTELLFNNLTEQLKLRSDLSAQYKTNLMSKSDAQIAESVIGYEIKQLTGKWPSKPKIVNSNIYKYIIPNNLSFKTQYMQNVLATIAKADFQLDGSGRLIAPKEISNLKINIGSNIYRMGIGGLHSSEENQAIIVDNDFILKDIDVASYYPKIVLNLGLYPHFIGKDFLTVYQTLVERRLLAKRMKNVAIAECLKITINGTFGKTGSPYSFLYAPEMTIQITVGGQLYLLMLIEQIELAGINVVSANTDGIVIKCLRSREAELNAIIKQWEQITGFETEETQYAALYSRDVNAYLAIKKPDAKGQIEAKGKNLYYDPWRGKTAKDGYWRFQKNPTAQICTEAVEKLICYNIPIKQTIEECKDITKFVCVKNVTGAAHKNGEYLGKVIRWAYFKNEFGTINKIINNNIVPDTLGALPLMDLPDIFPNNINYDWYINKTTEMLYDLAYLKKPQQMKLF